MKNKNILEFCLSPALGGLELFVKTSFEYFQKKTPTFVCVAKDKLLDKNINSNKKFTLKRNKIFPIFPALKLAKIIDKNDIDIVHFHWTKDMPTVVLAKIFSKKKPIIIQSRHMNITRFKDDFYHRFLYKHIDKIHSVTNEVKKGLEKYIPQSIRPKIFTIYLGVSEQKVDELKIKKLKQNYALKDEFIVGIIGRIEESKGQFIVIEAMKYLKDLNIKVFIIGHAMKEDYLRKLKQKVKDLSLEDRVIFTGFTKDVNTHLQLCNVSVLATKKETFGLIIIESMINKIPIIATNNSGPLEIIEDKKDGILFDRTAEDLAKKIRLIYEDKDLKDRLVKNAYQKVRKKFDKDKNLEKLYRKLN